MLAKIISCVAVCLLLCSCAVTAPEETVKYPRKPDNSSERKAGPAMSFYEQAEKDMDLENVIVTPPAELKKTDAEAKPLQ